MATPIVLSAGASYLLLSQETAGGDTWQDLGPVSTTPDVKVTGAIYTVLSNLPVVAPSSVGESYVPLNFLYTGGFASHYPSVTTGLPYTLRGLSYPGYPEFSATATPFSARHRRHFAA